MAKLLKRKSKKPNKKVRLRVADLILGESKKSKKLGKFDVVEISKDTWAPGIWAGSEGLKLSKTFGRSKKAKQLTVTGVDLENRIIILS